MIDDDLDEDALEAMGDEWLAANDPRDDLDGEADEIEGPFDTPTGDDPELAELLGDGAATGDAQLAWRETYYVLFQRSDRPTLTQVEAAVADSGRGFQIENLQADDDGLFLSVLIQSPEDNAALEISYESGDAVVEQSAELAKSLQGIAEGDQLAQLMRADARLDVMHFERLQDASKSLDAEDPDAAGFDALDPATLITVVEALADLTGGLPVDPAAGELLI